MSGSSLTNAQLRRILRQISKQVEGPIKPKYIDSINHLNFETFVSKFGSLAQACLEAGCKYDVEHPDPSVYAAGLFVDGPKNRTQLIEDLRHIVIEQEIQPSIDNYNAYGRVRYDETNPLFGSWPAAVLEAGLDATEIPGYTSPYEIVEELQRLTDQIGAPPSYKFAIKHGNIQPEVTNSRFPSWDIALQSAELDPKQIDMTREYITELEILAAELGHQPNKAEIELYLGQDTSVEIRHQFGSIDAALKIADVPDERSLTPTGSVADPVKENSEIPSHTDLFREIFMIKRRDHVLKEDPDNPEKQRKAFEDRGIIAEMHYNVQFGSLEEAFKYASELDARKFRPHRREIPDDPPAILREHAIELAEILGRRPLIDEVVALTDHSVEQYLEAFLSWDAVFEDESGNTHFKKNPALRLSNTDLLESIEQVGASIGRPPTPNDYREIGPYPVETVLRRYGSWPAALRAIGVDINTEIPAEYLATDLTRDTVHRAIILCENQFDHEAVLIDDVHRIMIDLGHVPDWNDIRKFGVWPDEVYKTAFADISGIIPASRINENATNRLELERIRSQLVIDLKNVSEISARSVWPTDIIFFGRYSIPLYLAVFETLQDAFAEAGLDIEHLPQTVASWETAWEPIFENARGFLEALQQEYKRTGEAPTMAEMGDAGISPQQCYDYYDSWREALQAAGVPPDQRTPRASGAIDDLLEELQNIAEELGHPPKTTDIDEHGKYGLSSYYKYYSNWQSALKDAGLTNSQTSVKAESSEIPTKASSDVVNQLLDDIDDMFDENN